MKPKDVSIADGSKEEYQGLVDKLIKDGIFKKLTKLDEW